MEFNYQLSLLLLLSGFKLNSEQPFICHAAKHSGKLEKALKL